MASYNADIRIGVTGKTQLNQLEAQLTRTQKQLNKLNKSLKLRAKTQAIKLDTRAANTQIKNLEQRINKLGRTITVNVRTNEQKRNNGAQGGGGVFVSNSTPAKQLAVAKSALPVAKALTNEAQDLLDTDLARNKAIENSIDLRKKVNTQLAKKADLSKKINTVENSTSERARTANMNRLFGGNTSKAGNPLSPKQSLALAKQETDRLTGSVKRARDAYKSSLPAVTATSKAYQQVAGNAKRAAEAETKAASAAKKQAQARGKFRKGFGAGAGVAGASALGNVPIAGDAVTGGLVASFTGGSVAAGAFAGALVGLTTALAGFAAESAKVRAQFDKLNISLKLAAGAEYAKSLEIIRRVVDDFNTPLVDATEQFTKLYASAEGSGIPIQDLENLFVGLSAATKAYAGDTEDLNGVFRAFSQIISKGTVQSEELKGQVGERLPGAFAKAAQSLGLTTAQLQKALEQGEIESAKFVKAFGKSMLEYEEKAKIIGDSPAEAGARLQKAITDLQVAIGPALTAIGAAFQDTFTGIIKIITDAANALNRFMANSRLTVQMNVYDGLKENAVSLQQLKNEIDADPSKRGDGWGQTSDKEYAALEDNLNRATTAADNAYTALQKLKNPELAVITSNTNKPPVLTGPDPTDKDKGKAKSGPTDRTAELRIELDLQTKLNALQNQTIIGTAKQVEDNQRELEVKRLLLEADAEKQRILIGNTTAQTKAMERMLVEKQLVSDLRDIELERAQTVFDRNEQLETTLRGLQEQIDTEGALTEELKLQYEWKARIAELEADGSKTPEEKERIESKINELYGQRITLLNPIVQYQRQLEKSLTDTDAMIVSLAQTVESELATAMSSAITGLVDGTKTAEEAFADMFANIGKAFIDMASEMIAKALIMKALGILTGGSGSGYTPSTGWDNFGKVFAEGGYVTGPTNALIGEGGEPEYVIPESKMGDAMQRYSAGASGDAVLGGSMSSPGGGEAGGESPTSINISGGVMQFGGEDFIRKDQLPAIIEQSSKMGEARTLRRLQMSPSSRRKVGI